MLLAMSVRLQFEGIRCFSEAQDAIIRPLTLLAGERSSGRSTFLALFQVASSIVDGYDQEFPCNFNEPPFLLGAFEQIAARRGGRAGRAESFSIAVSVDGSRPSGSIRADFVSQNGQPSLGAWRLDVGNSTWEVTSNSGGETVSLVVESAQGRHEVPDARRTTLLGLLDLPLHYLVAEPELKFPETLFSESEWESFRTVPVLIRQWFGRRTYALTPPVRSNAPIPPFTAHREQKMDQIEGRTGAFGSKPGWFEESDPFQIGVRSGDPPAIDDVFLLQQPEVHLHPRARAGLGSFFARQAGGKKRFVVETHSDCLVDRVRMEVLRGTIKPNDVSLLYFERRKNGAKIHNLELDRDGSVTNGPDGFRRFFLVEENDLQGI
jgi:hypothetical protein